MVVLESGKCEPLKTAVHGFLLGTVALCAAYNAAAWLKRRQLHLGINAIVYGAAIYWERCHVAHHLAACRLDLPQEPPNTAADVLPDAA